MDLNDLPGLVDNIKTKITQEFEDRILFAASLTLEANMKRRIFGEGKDKNGNQIGNYSTRPAYFEKDQFVRKGAFKPIGKNGTTKIDTINIKTKKKQKVAVKGNNKPRQSMYLKQGYKEFRDIQGRQTAFVDNKLSGSLEASIKTVKIRDNVTAIAITDARESKKRRSIERHFNKEIYAAGDDDNAVFKKAIDDETEHLRNIDYTKL